MVPRRASRPQRGASSFARDLRARIAFATPFGVVSLRPMGFGRSKNPASWKKLPGLSWDAAAQVSVPRDLRTRIAISTSFGVVSLRPMGFGRSKDPASREKLPGLSWDAVEDVAAVPDVQFAKETHPHLKVSVRNGCIRASPGPCRTVSSVADLRGLYLHLGQCSLARRGLSPMRSSILIEL